MMSSGIASMEHPFDKRVNEVQTPKSDINALILDYLTKEGYPDAAAKFCKEADLQPHQDFLLIRVRQQIQVSIQAGSIKDAIESLNDLDPEILDSNPPLHFSLLRLQLIELIRDCSSRGDDPSRFLPAVYFAQEHLADRAVTDTRLLDHLEKAMSLIVFPHNDLKPELAALLHPDLRREVADSVNKTILERQSERREAALRQLLSMRAWAENTARAAGKNIPEEMGPALHGALGTET